jgi:hypothetical protein
MIMNSSLNKFIVRATGILTLTNSLLWGAEIDKVLPLPQWHSPEIGTVPIPVSPETMNGTPLIPSALLTAEDLQDLIPMLPVEPPSLNVQIDEEKDFDLSLFLPDSLLGRTLQITEQPQPTPANELRALENSFIQACRDSPSDSYLIDPDTHVSETQREDLSRFLEFHNRDAKISAYVVVTDRDQIIPEGVDLSQIGSGVLTSRDSCLVVYPLGEPWRARVFLSNSVHRKANAEYLKSLIDDCATDAKEVTDPLEQMHRFTVRLSIRLFWLEKVTHSENPKIAEAPQIPLVHEDQENREAALTASMIKESQISSSLPKHWLVGGVALLSLLGLTTIAATWFSVHKKRLRTHVWMLPEVEAAPRLGGVFSGGGGASIRYR